MKDGVSSDSDIITRFFLFTLKQPQFSSSQHVAVIRETGPHASLQYYEIQP